MRYGAPLLLMALARESNQGCDECTEPARWTALPQTIAGKRRVEASFCRDHVDELLDAVGAGRWQDVDRIWPAGDRQLENRRDCKPAPA